MSDGNTTGGQVLCIQNLKLDVEMVSTCDCGKGQAVAFEVIWNKKNTECKVTPPLIRKCNTLKWVFLLGLLQI